MAILHRWNSLAKPHNTRNGELWRRKRADHADAIRREVEVMRRLRGCLNVASLEEVYEDDAHVHLVMEACHGGELHHRIGDRHYSERTVRCCAAALGRRGRAGAGQEGGAARPQQWQRCCSRRCCGCCYCCIGMPSKGAEAAWQFFA
jgi:hypothetical protein